MLVNSYNQTIQVKPYQNKIESNLAFGQYHLLIGEEKYINRALRHVKGSIEPMEYYGKEASKVFDNYHLCKVPDDKDEDFIKLIKTYSGIENSIGLKPRKHTCEVIYPEKFKEKSGLSKIAQSVKDFLGL